MPQQDSALKFQCFAPSFPKELEKYGTFSFGSKKYTYAKAILAIETLVDELIKENDIAAVFIEDIQLRVNVQSFKKLAQLQGVLVNLFEKNEYLYSFVAPTQWQVWLQLSQNKLHTSRRWHS